jgi:hypothetical protein
MPDKRTRVDLHMRPDGIIGDMADIYLPDGRIVSVTYNGQLLVSRYGVASDWVSEGHASMWIPDPPLDSADHLGYAWDAVKTRRRYLRKDGKNGPEDPDKK